MGVKTVGAFGRGRDSKFKYFLKKKTFKILRLYKRSSWYQKIINFPPMNNRVKNLLVYFFLYPDPYPPLISN